MLYFTHIPGDISTKITPQGRAMACFPVAPRYGKMLSLGHQHNLLPYVVAIVAGLSVQEVFVEVERPGFTDEEVSRILLHVKCIHVILLEPNLFLL